MSKKKPTEEAAPDLNAAEDQAAVEARIREMMEIEATAKSTPAKSSVKKSITVKHDDEFLTEALDTAPELPSGKKSQKINVTDHNDLTGGAETELETAPELAAVEDETAQQPPNEEDPEVLAAIEKANEQLKEVAEEIPDDSEQTTEVSGSDEDQTEDLPETDEAVAEDNTKQKPLSHLDNHIPKTKTDEVIDDAQTNEIVDDIIASDSDALLEAEDEKLAEATKPEVKPKKLKRLWGFIRRKGVRRTIIFVLFVTLLVLFAIPSSRYFVLNSAGVRSSASLTVLDDSTRQPLKNVQVVLGGQESTTDHEGRANFTKVKLGNTQLVIKKRAFAVRDQQVVIGWGSNPLPEYSLTPTGSQYNFILTDYLSGKPIAKAEATSNEANAVSNEQGELKLTIDAADQDERVIVFSIDGYRLEQFTLDLDSQEDHQIKMVSNKKHVFISKRSGRYDVYKVDIDGKNEKLVLPGTGSERQDMVLVSHPNEEIAALVSTKDNKRNDGGFLLSTLTIINLSEETTKAVATSERVQIIDWASSRIVYVTVKEGASGNDPDRHKLISYDYKSGQSTDLASSNYFNDVLVAGGKVYYAPSSTFLGKDKAHFFIVDSDGNNSQTILNQEVWNVFRGSYDKLSIATQSEWYELKIGELQAGKISGEPPSQVSRVYIDSPDGKQSLWVDNRDGKGVLLSYDKDKQTDVVVRTQGGLKGPVRWLSNRVVIYRINTESETADYALSLDGGEPVKIKDVTNTSGINSWYYY